MVKARRYATLSFSACRHGDSWGLRFLWCSCGRLPGIEIYSSFQSLRCRSWVFLAFSSSFVNPIGNNFGGWAFLKWSCLRQCRRCTAHVYVIRSFIRLSVVPRLFCIVALIIFILRLLNGAFSVLKRELCLSSLVCDFGLTWNAPLSVFSKFDFGIAFATILSVFIFSKPFGLISLFCSDSDEIIWVR